MLVHSFFFFFGNIVFHCMNAPANLTTPIDFVGLPWWW